MAIAEAARPVASGTDDPSVRGRRTVGINIGWFVASYLATGLLRRRPSTLAAALLLTFVARMALRTDRGRIVAFALVLAVLGTGYEHRLAGTGAFGYAEPALGNVPVWLPGLYLHGAPLAVDLVAADLARAGSGRGSARSPRTLNH